LFYHNLVLLLQKSVYLTDLFNSKILYHTFDYDEWPGSHSNTDKMLAAYNSSIFRIREHYATVFPSLAPKKEAKNMI